MYGFGDYHMDSMGITASSMKRVETVHVGQSQEDNQKECRCEDALEYQQTAVLQLSDLTDLLDNPIGIEWDERPMDEACQKSVRYTPGEWSNTISLSPIFSSLGRGKGLVARLFRTLVRIS